MGHRASEHQHIHSILVVSEDRRKLCLAINSLPRNAYRMLNDVMSYTPDDVTVRGRLKNVTSYICTDITEKHLYVNLGRLACVMVE